MLSEIFTQSKNRLDKSFHEGNLIINPSLAKPSWSETALFVIQNLNLYLQSGLSNPTG